MPSFPSPWPSFALLVLGAFSALVALNATRPTRPAAWRGTFVFFLGWLTGELAMHHAILQLVIALYLISRGALDHSAGMVGFGLAVAGWAALMRFHERGHRASEVTRLALGTGGDGTLAHGGVRVRLRDVARPFSFRRPDVTRVQRVLVHRGDGYSLHADVYHRGDKPAGAPVVVYVHGGGWMIGFKRYQGLPILYRLASEGWVCISIDYRLSPRATFPDHAIDVMRGIAWAKEHAAEYGGDPSFVAICGNSAGAHLASLAALTHDEPALKPGFENADTRVDACVGLYGVYDFTNRHGHWPGVGVRPFLERVVVKQRFADAPEMYRLASPIDHVRNDAPPFFLVHGDCDTLVPVEESRRFVDALRGVSTNPVMYAEIEDAQHAFEIFHSIRGRYAVSAIAEFLTSAHRTTSARRAADSASLQDDSRAGVEARADAR